MPAAKVASRPSRPVSMSPCHSRSSSAACASVSGPGPSHPASRARGGLPSRRLEPAAERLAQRREGRIPGGGRTRELQHRLAVDAGFGKKGAGQHRLAGAGLGGDRDPDALARTDTAPGVAQHAELAFAADQRAGRRRQHAQRLSPAHQPVDLDGLGNPPQLDRAETLDVVRGGDEPARRLRQNDRVHRRVVFEARRKVRHHARHGVRFVHAAGAHLADQHAAGVHRQPGREVDAALGLQRLAERRDLVDDLERRVGGAAGRVLVRPRVAEIGHDAVAEVLGDHAAASFDRRGADRLVKSQQLAQVLGIHAG